MGWHCICGIENRDGTINCPGCGTRIDPRGQLEQAITRLGKKKPGSPIPGRSKNWILWPVFHMEKDARDVATWGCNACALMAVVTAWMQYPMEKGFLVAPLSVLVYGLLGYFTYHFSRFAATSSFIAYVVEDVYRYSFAGEPLNVLDPFFALLLFHAMRAAYWYDGEMKKLAMVTSGDTT